MIGDIVQKVSLSLHSDRSEQQWKDDSEAIFVETYDHRFKTEIKTELLWRNYSTFELNSETSELSQRNVKQNISAGTILNVIDKCLLSLHFREAHFKFVYLII